LPLVFFFLPPPLPSDFSQSLNSDPAPMKPLYFRVFSRRGCSAQLGLTSRAGRSPNTFPPPLNLHYPFLPPLSFFLYHRPQLSPHFPLGSTPFPRGRELLCLHFSPSAALSVLGWPKSSFCSTDYCLSSISPLPPPKFSKLFTRLYIVPLPCLSRGTRFFPSLAYVSFFFGFRSSTSRFFFPL